MRIFQCCIVTVNTPFEKGSYIFLKVIALAQKTDTMLRRSLHFVSLRYSFTVLLLYFNNCHSKVNREFRSSSYYTHTHLITPEFDLFLFSISVFLSFFDIYYKIRPEGGKCTHAMLYIPSFISHHLHCLNE